MKRKTGKTLLSSTALLLFAVLDLRPADWGVKFLSGWARVGVDHYAIAGTNRIGLGIGVETWFFKMLGMETGAFFVEKGYSISGEPQDHGFSEISFPVLLKARIFLDGASTLSLAVMGGAAYSRFLTEMDPDYRQHDWHILAGASLEKRLGRIGLLIEARQDWGLLEQSDHYMPDRLEFKTRTFLLLAGAQLHF